MRQLYFSGPPHNDMPQPIHELRYQSLYREGRGFSFPCNETGHVDLNALSDGARTNYLFARAMVGRELAMPQVRVVSFSSGASASHHAGIAVHRALAA